ncbi:B-cell receptor CD22 [Astyanax mexicanus]|uniref:B-cell receptor CD22 n=1 Tax=Astyanax mexicanus TaxID=7994 RepID=UPI0020CACDB6|nr:B-cell receptor CD22 [Astyanax mexicanus]
MDGRGKSSTKVSVMILLRMRLTVPLLIMIFSSGDGAQSDWGVTYYPESICALKGSTVNMSCTYKYPTSSTNPYIVQTAFWTKNDRLTSGFSEFPNLSTESEYKGRVQYFGNNINYSILSLSNVTENDQRNYYFRFITNKEGGKWWGAGGIALSVTGLQVEGPETVREGGKVTLTCKTTCNLTSNSTYTWYRNGLYIDSSTKQLYLQLVSREDAGRYSCAVLGQDLRSPEVTLNVLYGPKSTSVSISPSGEIVEGSSVTLNCSSDGNPPVQYTWYKGSSSVATGKTFTMNNISSVNSGEYKCNSSNDYGQISSATVTLNVLYPPKSVSVSISPSGEIVEGSSVTLTCSSDGNPPVEYTWYKGSTLVAAGKNFTINNISPVNSGEYKCRSSNKLKDINSDIVTLNVLYGPKSISVSISPSGKIVEGSSVTLTCSSDGNPPVEYYWYKGTSLVTKGENFTLNNISSVNSGEYKCRSSNKHGEKYSDAVTLNVLYPPKNTSVSISPSGEIVEGSSVTLTCSSDGNPPVQKYTWFKDGGSSPVGSGHSYSFTLDSESSGQYYCEAQNEHGSRGSEAVLLNFKRSVTLYVIGGVVVGCVGLILALVILFIRRKRRGPVAEDPKTKEESIYNNVAANQDDGLYATVEPPRPMNPRTEKRSAVSHEEVQYGNIQHCHRQDIKMTEEDDVQYASVNFSRTSQDHRNAPEDSSVIYSGVK